MSPKRNPKSKRVHDSDSGKFISEDKINELTPFGYNDGNDSGSTVFWIALAILTIGLWYAYSNGLFPF